MSTPQICVKPVTSPAEIQALQKIRITVFQQEQGVPEDLDFDGLDEICILIIAKLNQDYVGTVRVRYVNAETAKIERLAVLKSARGYGIGKLLMSKAVEIATEKGMHQAVIHAQEYIKSLHEQLGFQAEGDVFEEAGIRHVKMRKILIK